MENLKKGDFSPLHLLTRRVLFAPSVGNHISAYPVRTFFVGALHEAPVKNLQKRAIHESPLRDIISLCTLFAHSLVGEAFRLPFFASRIAPNTKRSPHRSTLQTEALWSGDIFIKLGFYGAQSNASTIESTKGISLSSRIARPIERKTVSMNCNGPFPFLSKRPSARYLSASGM